MNYPELISKSWKFLWRHKILWLFGILAPAAYSGSSGSQFNSGGGGGGSNLNFSDNLPPNFEQFWTTLNRLSLQNTKLSLGSWLVILLAFILIAILVSLFLGTFGITGLIKGASMADQKNDDKPLKYREIVQNIGASYWRIFAVRAFLALFGIAIALLIGLVFYLAFRINPGVMLGLGLVMLPLFCILIPFQFVLDIMMRNTFIAVVDEELKVLAAFRKAWAVIRQNLGQFIIVHILLAVIGLVSSLILFFPSLFAFAPLAVGLVSGTPQLIAGSIVITILLFGFLILLGILLKGLLNPFLTNISTLAYRRLRDRNLIQPVAFDPTIPRS